MPQGLFRQEVVDARRSQWLGSIVIAAPLSRWLLTALAVAVATAVLLLLVVGHYTRHETVTGQLVPSAGLLNIAAPSAGTISRLNVHDGQAIKAGDVLLRLSGEQDSAALGGTDVAGKANETQRQIAAVTQSMAQNEMQRAVVLRASRAGVVSSVLLKAGQTVSAGQPLLSILPAGSILQAQLLVPSRAIGFIEPGNQVVMRYRAFAYQKFGQQYGRVIGISRSALNPPELAALLGAQPSGQSVEPLYRVQVALDSQTVLAYGRPESVKPGMTLDADILTDRRRLIEWVFEPLYGIAHHLAGGASHG